MGFQQAASAERERGRMENFWVKEDNRADRSTYWGSDNVNTAMAWLKQR
jgi:hypothetical protein